MSKPATLLSLMRHLKAYAEFLEARSMDWRHFPVRRDQRVLVHFRGELIDQISRGDLHASTARSRMSAVIQFYRYAHTHGFITSAQPLWAEKTVSVPWSDSTGFKRSMTRIGTDLSIPNRARPGQTLEDGLLPLSSHAMMELLRFTGEHQTSEIHLMLSLGFFTGARLSTITSLRRESLDSAFPDPLTPGFHLIRIGPGTKVVTKFDVSGNLLLHDLLLSDLKRYAASTERLLRQAKAKPADKTLLFLTRRGNAYSVNSVDRLVQELRKQALRGGMRFMERFKFHQTRATYGTWLMQFLLGVTTVSAAVEFVRSAMLHKYEATTFRYLRFLDNAKRKGEIAQAFSDIFTGLRVRDWDQIDA